MITWIKSVDIRFSDWMYSHVRTPVFDRLMPYVTIAGNAGLVWFLLIGILFLYTADNTAFFGSLFALFFSILFGTIALKYIIRRPRPFSANTRYDIIIPKPRDFSFPSGHAFSSFASATAIFLYWPSLGVLSMVLAVLISFSRLYLCVHYLSDVIFSIFAGLVTGYVVHSIF